LLAAAEVERAEAQAAAEEPADTELLSLAEQCYN